MSSRNYNLAFDTPYNQKLISVLDKYRERKDLNGEPDIFTDRMQGGAFLGEDGVVHTPVFRTLPYHPHLPHSISLLGSTGGNLAKSLGNFGKKVATNVASKIAEKAVLGAVLGGSVGGIHGYGLSDVGGRPPGMVSSFVPRVPDSAFVRPSTHATYPQYNAIELKKIQGGRVSKCNQCCGGDSIISKEKEAELTAKKPRGRPKKSGGKVKMAVLKGLKTIGESAGKPFKKISGVNPFSLGYDLGHDVIGPAIKGRPNEEGGAVGVGVMKKPRGRPRKQGGKFNPTNALINIGAKYTGQVAEKQVSDAVAPKKKSGGAVDGRKARAEIVKKIMKERGVKMVEASKIVKAEGLYKK